MQQELAARGRNRNRNEIKHAIKVMSRCVLTLHQDGEEIWNGSILQDLVTVARAEYLADTNTQHIARLPLFVSHAINRLDYRQFNYDRLMRCNEQLTRWIYKQLIHRFRHAGIRTAITSCTRRWRATAACCSKAGRTITATKSFPPSTN